MLTRDQVLDWMEQDLKKMDDSLRLSKLKLEKHLSKFKNLDNLFLSAESIILEYYSLEKSFGSLEEFKNYLIKWISKYMEYLTSNLSYEETFKLEKELDNFDEKYDKLIYYWEFNPIEAKRQREKSKSNWLVWKIKWHLKKII